MYARLAQNIQMAQPAYRAYQPTDFRAAPRQQYQFDPATDPSRIVLAKLAERAAKDKADAEAKATAAATDDSWRYEQDWNQGNG
jgi:hypothetical protein